MEAPAASTGYQHIPATLVIALRGYVGRERLAVVLPQTELALTTEEPFRPM